MAELSYRQPMHELLMSELEGLTHTNSSDQLFGSVVTVMIGRDNPTPVAEVIPGQMTIESQGIEEDSRIYSFNIIVYESIESTSTDAEAQAVVFSVEDIEDVIVKYFEEVPQSMERALAGIHIYRTLTQSSDPMLISQDQGIGLVLRMNILLYVNIQTKNLN